MAVKSDEDKPNALILLAACDHAIGALALVADASDEPVKTAVLKIGVDLKKAIEAFFTAERGDGVEMSALERINARRIGEYLLIRNSADEEE